MTGADLILPGRSVDARTVATLIEQERVTVSGSVPTVWMDLLRYADRHRPDFSSLRMLACGGSAAPRSLMQRFQERHGVELIELWRMTATSPLCTVAWPRPGTAGEEYWCDRDTASRLLPLVEARIVDDRGRELPWDGESTGELQVRGPWIAAGYADDPAGADGFDGGWLPTRDVAWIDARGYVKVTARAKDVIKSGSECISSIALEAHLAAHPDVVEAAVIAMPHARWAERPLACVVLADGASCAPEDLRATLRRGCRSGGSPRRSPSSTLSRRRASASSTRRRCASGASSGRSMLSPPSLPRSWRSSRRGNGGVR
jgi:fatty-acyl-CoA synthase